MQQPEVHLDPELAPKLNQVINLWHQSDRPQGTTYT